MKRKIIIGLAAFSLLLLLAGLSILRIIHNGTSRLNELVMLHQVEIMREHFLIQVSRVQTDLSLQGTDYSRDFDTVVKNVRNMDMVIGVCSSCHHAESVEARILDLSRQTEAYKRALSRVLTVRADSPRLAREQDLAFRLGERLTEQVREMIAMTAARLEQNTQKSLKEIDNSKYVLYVLVGVVPLVSAVLGYVFISGLTRPVNTLLGSTRRLTAGDLDHRVTGLKHEFGELAGAFNEMAVSLREQMQKVQRTERMAVLGELSAGLAHEIKNPLAGIKVAMDVLAGEADLSDEDRAVVSKVGGEVTRLEMLMKSFLNFARPPKPQPSDVNVNALLNTTLALYGDVGKRPVGSVNEVKIEKQFGTVPETMADPMQLQQVFLNLVINAVDAMPAGGTLSVRTFRDEDSGSIAIGIADTGEGIDKDHATKIFEPFFTTKRGGTGLGLAISRQLIEQHGGSIEVGQNPGGGTVFTIRLPLRGDERQRGSAA